MEMTAEWVEALALPTAQIQNHIAQTLQIAPQQVRATLQLLAEQNTVPFIARYRKERTHYLDEEAIRAIEQMHHSLSHLETRRIEILRSLFKQDKLSPRLLASVQAAQSLSALEDIYAPYKQKRKTRGMKAIEQGLEPLADHMTSLAAEALQTMALTFVDPEKGVENPEQALQGAMDILAERISQNQALRAEFQAYLSRYSILCVSGKENYDSSTYQMYYMFQETLPRVKPHHTLAINRGEREGELMVRIDYDKAALANVLDARETYANFYHERALRDGCDRLLVPSILRELRSVESARASQHGIDNFAMNLKHLLLQPPIQKTRLLAIDPGLRTGCKAVALDADGQVLDHFTFFPRRAEALSQVLDCIARWKLDLVAIGNGTGSHETQEWLTTLTGFSIPFTVVSEQGASVYSASPIAKEEFPDLDVSVRGAVSIGRRLQDPLAELVKIDPKSLGVGMYQHDVDQKALAESLDTVVESVVNLVGVNLHTASEALLRYVSGMNTRLAKAVLAYHHSKGIPTRQALLDVPGMGAKLFEQAAGFLRIPDSPEPLDNSWVHPENYTIARHLQAHLHPKPAQKQVQAWAEQFDVSLQGIQDLLAELGKPSRDPRSDYPAPIFQQGALHFEDLRVGAQVTGKALNVVDFGVFVDIGIKETALLHISHMADGFVAHPSERCKVGDTLQATIIELDEARRRISLSMRSQPLPAKPPQKPVSSSKDNLKQSIPPKPPAARAKGTSVSACIADTFPAASPKRAPSDPQADANPFARFLEP